MLLLSSFFIKGDDLIVLYIYSSSSSTFFISSSLFCILILDYGDSGDLIEYYMSNYLLALAYGEANHDMSNGSLFEEKKLLLVVDGLYKADALIEKGY
jgi:hypothetical protein